MPKLSNRKLKIISKLLVESESAPPSFDETAIQQSEANGRPEGALRQGLTPHYYRERDPTLRPRKLAEMIERFGKLSCECCADEADRYGDKKVSVYEVHHTIPLAAYDGGEITNLNEVALLCANCHRMVHSRNPPKSVEDLKTELNR
jgi:5-methylcytosine-specific restriction protein A